MDDFEDFTGANDYFTNETNFGVELEDQRSRLRHFRRQWIPQIKIIIASAVDIFGDWLFFVRTKNVDGLDEYEFPLFFFCVVSSVLGAFTVVSITGSLFL